MNDKKLPQLPTPKLTETIRGVPCITVTEHEHLMRTYALQARAQVQVPMTPLTDAQMEKGRDQIFSINNPYCPCDRKTFKKVAQWVERHHQIGITAQAKKETP